MTTAHQLKLFDNLSDANTFAKECAMRGTQVYAMRTLLVGIGIGADTIEVEYEKQP